MKAVIIFLSPDDLSFHLLCATSCPGGDPMEVAAAAAELCADQLDSKVAQNWQ
jgi:hypothetical protein